MRKTRLPRAPRPRLVSGCCLRSTRARPRLLHTAWSYSGYSSCFGPGGLVGCIPHIFYVKVVLALLALGNLDLSCGSSWCSVSGCCCRVLDYWIYWEMTSGIFRVTSMLRVLWSSSGSSEGQYCRDYGSLCAVFLLSLSGPDACIMAGMDRLRYTFDSGSGIFQVGFAGILHLALCSFRGCQAQMPSIMGRYEPEG